MRPLFYILATISLLTGCHAKRDLGEITVAGAQIRKNHYKTHDQFIQIAYIDLFNKTIGPERLNTAKRIFDSQGDDDLSYKMFIKQLISEAAGQIPPDDVVKKEPEKFVVQSYLKFFGRYPNGYEKKLLVNEINTGKSISAAKIYYILMTTEEYRMF